MALKIIILIAIALALILVLTTTNLKSDTNKNISLSETSINDGEVSHFPTTEDSFYLIKPKTRVSRFLAEQKENPNPRAADHCKNDDEICYELVGINGTCCNNKCMDLSTDDKNCGACKSKCKKYTDSCCGGKCVDLAYDKGNCGVCGKKCEQGKYCIYGMCDYA